MEWGVWSDSRTTAKFNGTILIPSGLDKAEVPGGRWKREKEGEERRKKRGRGREKLVEMTKNASFCTLKSK